MSIYLWALYAREVKRFQKLWLDTVLSPLVSMGLYLAVFGVVIGSRTVSGFNYLAFVYTGLLGMVMVNSSFSNPSFALIISKNVGNIIDLQLVPIKTWGVGIAYALAALTRGFCTVVVATLLSIWFIPGIQVQHPLMLLFAVCLTGIQFGMFGVIFGMWAKNFEALTFVTTFVLQPMIFLAGVFYPVATLPGVWAKVSLFNPLHHNINLFRYGFLGYSDISPTISFVVCLVLSLVFFVFMQHFTKKMIRPA